MKRILMVAVILWASSADAEIVKLKSGEILSGTILEKSDQEVICEIDGERRTFAWEDIKEIVRSVKPVLTLKEEVTPAEETKPEASSPEAVPVEEPPAVSRPDIDFNDQGFRDMAWGEPPAAAGVGLAYAVTDSVTGSAIYVDPPSLDAFKRERKEVPQYYFFKDKFYKIHLPVTRLEQWQGFETSLTERYGPSYHLEGAKDVQQWETGEMIVVLRFDHDSQSGYLEAQSKKNMPMAKPDEAANIQNLITALEDADADVRARAATNLAMMPNDRATLPLIRAFKDDNFIVRYNVALALGEIRDPRAVLPLIQALEDEDDLVRSFAAEALGKIGDQRALEALIVHVDENDAALKALQKMTGKDFGAEAEAWRTWWKKQKAPLEEEVAL